MGRPRVVSVTSKVAEERTPPDEAGVQVLESYVPKALENSQVAGLDSPLLQQPQMQKPAASGNGLFGSIFSKISSFFRR